MGLRLSASVAWLGAVLSLTLATRARAEGDADDFKQNCWSCHTIGGGRLVGPDLKDVTAAGRAPSRAWLVDFIPDPQSKLQGGDPYASKLRDEARGAVMAQVSGMTKVRAEALLTFIEAESKKEKSTFASTGVSDRAFTPQDIEIGREIFLGRRPLAAGGPACLSCHQSGEAGAMGGGRLGPDLGDAFARLGGRKALGSWLRSPPTPTMKPVFGAKPLDPDAEILAILAFLKDTSDRNVTPSRTGQRLTFVLLGITGASGLLILADLAWRRRFRGVRSALVKGAS